MANPNLAPTALEKYQFFRTYASISWDSGTPRMVYKFTHTLAQYLPSSYAEICVVYPKNEINNFMKIESLPIVSRAVWVSCITDGYGPGYLYNKVDNQTLFGGPWKLVVNDYAVNPMPPTMLGSETDPFPKEAYLVTMKCVDPVWYSMQQEAKIGVFSRSKFPKLSDCIKHIFRQHGSTDQYVADTNVSFNWLQSNMTDYEFIRSILAYCNPPGFHFYCNNETGYFRQIGTGTGESGGNTSAGSIVVDIRGTQTDQLVSIVNKQFLEKFSDGAVMIPYGEGFNDSDHTQREANPVGGNINTGSGGKRYIKFSIDNEAIKQAFSANVTFRTRMFGRVAKMRTNLMTNANPLQTISITNNNPDKYPNFVSNGEEWYIISVKNVIGWNITWPETPHCWLVVARGGA